MAVTTATMSKYVTGGGRLPSEYQEVEYLQSTGTQWLDTDVVPNLDYTTEVKAIKAKGNALFGSGGGNYTFTGNAATNFAYIGGGSYKVVACSDQSLPHIWKIADRIAYCDDNYSVRSTEITAPVYSIALFARKISASSANDGGNHKIYYAKIWDDNGTLVRNLIPCYRISDSVPGMYDLVSNTFYTNQGTGSFIVGPDVVREVVHSTLMSKYFVDGSILPSEYQETEWISNSGTPVALPFNYTVSDSTLFEIKVNVLTPSSTTNFFSNGTFGSNLTLLQADLSNRLQVFWRTSSGYGQSATFSSSIKNRWCDIKVGKIGQSYIVKVDNEEKTFYSVGRTPSDTTKVVISPNYRTAYFTIKENDVKLFEFIPCYRISDSVPGMYDLVSNTFYTNQGTGSFIVGPDVVREVVHSTLMSKYFVDGTIITTALSKYYYTA